MTRLSVNINKIALIRNSRSGNFPDLIKIAADCESFGAQGITVHPRPDQRHIRYADIPELKKVVQTEFNIEGYPSPDFIELVLQNKPDQVTLVPDPPNVLTSDRGWDFEKESDFLRNIIEEFRKESIRVSLFVEANPKDVVSAHSLKSDRVELYTGKYAKDFLDNPELAILPHREAAMTAYNLGIGLNAGHDLNLTNLRYYKTNVMSLLEVSIGHALVVDALYYGLQNVIPMYLNKLSN